MTFNDFEISEHLFFELESICWSADGAIVMNWPWKWHSIFTFPECASGPGIHVDIALIWSAHYSLSMSTPRWN
jgi:hypothetical protein